MKVHIFWDRLPPLITKTHTKKESGDSLRDWEEEEQLSSDAESDWGFSSAGQWQRSHVSPQGNTLPQTPSLAQKIVHSHNIWGPTHALAQIRWLSSCYGRSGRSVVLQKPDDSAHSFLWLSLCSAPHIPPINRTACQLVLPSWLLPSTTFYFTWGPRTH